jgi:hypothetical protein
MQYDFTWLLLRLTPAEKRAVVANELAYFFPPQQALSFLFFSAERESMFPARIHAVSASRAARPTKSRRSSCSCAEPRLRSTSPSVVFASSWLRVRCKQMMQHALRSMLVERFWLHLHYDTSVTLVLLALSARIAVGAAPYLLTH